MPKCRFVITIYTKVLVASGVDDTRDAERTNLGWQRSN
jgi:hypothetical protein